MEYLFIYVAVIFDPSKVGDDYLYGTFHKPLDTLYEAAWEGGTRILKGRRYLID